MAANDTIQSIKIGIGLDAKEFVESARAAKRELEKAVPARMERFLTLRAKVDPSLAQVDNVTRQIEKRLNDNLKRALVLTPKFTVSGKSVTDLQKSVNDQLKTHPIEVPIKIGKIDGPAVRKQILDAIGVPSIPFTWHWQGEPPPGGAAPAGGGRRGGGGGGAPATPPPAAPPPTEPAAPAGGRGGRRAAPPPTAVVAPTPAAPAPLTRQPRPARGRVTPPQATATPTTVVSGQPPQRMSIDELRARPTNYTEEEKLLHLYERSLPIRQSREQTRGVRGAGRAGVNVYSPEDLAILQRAVTPEEIARREVYRQRAAEIAAGFRTSAAIKRRQDPDYQRARNVVRGLRGIKYDAKGFPDITTLQEAMTQSYGAEPGGSLAEAWWHYLMGDLQGAGAMATEALKSFRPFSGIKRAGRKMTRVTDPTANPEAAPADVLVFHALAKSLQSEELVSENANAAVRKATRQGKTFNRGGGFVAGVAADAKYYARLRNLLPDLTGPEPEMTGETILTTGAGAESIAEAQALAATKRKAPASERRRKAKSAADNFARRMERANQLGMTIQEFMATDEGQRMMRGRAWGGPIGSPKVDKYYRNATGVLEKIFPMAAIDVRGIHPENLDQMLASAHHMSALFPETARSLMELRGFTPLEMKQWWMARGQRPPLMATGPALAPTATGYQQMGTRMWYDRGRLGEPLTFRRAHATGWSTARDMRDIFTHEFGHAVAFNAPEAFVYDAHRAGNLRSQYAMSNRDEYWAEAFAKFHRGEDVGPAITRSILDAMAGERGLPMSWVKRLDLENEDMYAAGGRIPRRGRMPKHGIYKVGERGEELFVPEEAGWIIPHHLMDQLPKREAGGGVRPLQYRGSRGRYTSGAAAATAAMAAGIASPANATPVAVVNWPPAFVSPAAQAAAARGNVNAPGAAALAAALGGNVAGGLSPLAGGFSMRANALTRQQARAEASDFADVFAARLVQARTNVSEALNLTPARALSVMFGQIAQVRFGGRAGILERRDVAGRAIEQANREVGALRSLRQNNLIMRSQRNAAVAQGAPQDVIDQLNTDLGVGLQAQLQQSRRARRFTRQAEEASQRVATRGDVVRSAGVGLLGIIGGTVAFTAAMHIAQLAIDTFSNVAEKGVDALSGFNLTMNRVTADLAQAVRQAGVTGAAGVVAGRAGALGVPAGVNLGPLIGRARLEAGNLNLAEGIDLIRANQAVRAQASLGRGAVPGLTQTTGGIFGTPINGTPSTAELISGAVAGPADIGNALWLSGLGQLLGPNENFLNGDAINMSLRNLADGMVAANDEWFRTFNDYSKKAGDQYGQILQGQGQDAVDATLKAWTDAGLNIAQAQRLTVGGRSLQGIGRDPLANRQLALNFLQGVNTGAGIPTREFMQESLLKPLSGALARIELTGQRQRDLRIPTDIALTLRRQPQLAPGTGLQGATAQDAANLGKYVDEVARYQQITQDLAGPGNDWLAKLPPQAQEAVQQLTQLGQEIADMQTRMSNIQVGFANEQWLNQQTLALRQAGDMVGLLGDQERTVRLTVGFDKQGNDILENRVVQATELGRLQREQLMLSRETQRIEFQIQQREINFQRAVAGIEVPGRTPGEQQAFVDAANRRAQEAQEALDRSRKAFRLGVQIEDISLGRQAEDFLNITLPEMFKGHAVEVETRGLSAAISEAQRAQGAIDAFVESFKTEQVAFEDAIFDAWLTTETEMNSFADRYKDTVSQGLAELSSQYSSFIQGTYVPGQGGMQTGKYGPINPNGVNPGTRPTSGLPYGPPPAGMTWEQYYHSQGVPGYATGAYNVGSDRLAMLHRGEMVMPTHVANWMRGSSYSSGGGGMVVIQINNPVVRDDSDIDKLARAVEQVMNKRAISIGVLTNN